MEDYPHTLAEFEDRFTTEDACRAYLVQMRWPTNQKHGVSALGLQRLLGLGSCRTGWACLQKLRRAMVRTGRDSLSGQVEVDETYIGGVEAGGGRRRVGKKGLVGVAARG